MRVCGRGCSEAYGGRPLTATLAGVVGDATTDQDGAGSATFTLNQGHGQICYDVAWTALDEVSGLHVHTASNNAIVVPLDADTVLSDGSAKGCVNGIAKNLIKAIRQHPEQYYVNVHTNDIHRRRDPRHTPDLDPRELARLRLQETEPHCARDSAQRAFEKTSRRPAAAGDCTPRRSANRANSSEVARLP